MSPSVGELLDQGLKLHLAGDLARAEAIYRAIVREHPRNGDALNMLGALALQTNRVSESIELLERAMAAGPHVAAYQGNLGAAYLAAGRSEEALLVITRALKLTPSLRDANYNQAVAYYNLGQLDDARASYERSLHYQPEDARTNNNLGNLCLELGRTDEALMHLEIAIRLDPNLATARYNRGLALLRLGRLAEGWVEYEWRLRTQEVAARKLAQPAWNGEPLGQKTLFLYAEQGLGDTIQLIRYLPLVRERCPQTVVEVQPALLPILEYSGFAGLLPQGSPLPEHDAQLSLSSVPGVLGTTLESIPHPTAYLKADQALVAKWQSILAAYEGLKVGVAWQGSPAYREDRFRSVPFVYYFPLAQVPGVRLFSLQKGAGREQLAALRNQFHVVDLMARDDVDLKPFMDTAAILKCLDLVITSDTAIAHLAGALGVETWLALRIGPDWRWMDRGRDSPWYSSLRLFRQKSFGDWPGVFAEMAQELAVRAQGLKGRKQAMMK